MNTSHIYWVGQKSSPLQIVVCISTMAWVFWVKFCRFVECFNAHMAVQFHWTIFINNKVVQFQIWQPIDCSSFNNISIEHYHDNVINELTTFGSVTSQNGLSTITLQGMFKMSAVGIHTCCQLLSETQHWFIDWRLWQVVPNRLQCHF